MVATRQLISALASAIPTGDAPREIVYLPEGRHDITPRVNGVARKITVIVPPEKGEAIAASLQSSLDERSAQNVRPWFDFEHKHGAASAIPSGFRYEPGKGIMAAVEWTDGGRRAVEGRDFSYFSPEFLIDGQGLPCGLPERGPLGGLVNEPAFRDIPRIAAMQADESKTYMKQLYTKLGIDPDGEQAEAQALAKIEELQEQVTKLTAERDELKSKLVEVEAMQQQDRVKRADDLIAAAKADGRIAPKDEATAGRYHERIAAGDAFAEEVLRSLPKGTDLSRSVVVQAASAAVSENKSLSGFDLLQASFKEEAKNQ